MIRISRLRLSPKICVAVLFAFIFLVLLLCVHPKQNNVVTDEIKSINLNIRKHYQKQPDYRGLNTKTAIKDNLIPSFMVRQNKIFSRLKREILVGRNASGDSLLPADHFFAIAYLNVDKAMCISIISEPFDITLGLRDITLLNNKTSLVFSYGGEFPLPVNKEVAEKHCHSLNTVVLSFE